MRANILRLVKNIKGNNSSSQTSIESRYIPRVGYINTRWQSSGQGDTTEDPDQKFGVLRKRVLEKVGENLDRIMQFNAFELFGVRQQFRVDTNLLQREMRQLQRILHPDKFVDADKGSQRKSDYLSAAVNDFYKILTNPYERGKYLLSLEWNKSASDIEKSLDELQLDGGFLARMMELRETVSDPECDKLELTKMGSVIEGEMQDLIRELDGDFKSNNTKAILEKLGKLKFLVNCHRTIADRDDTFSVY